MPDPSRDIHLLAVLVDGRDAPSVQSAICRFRADYALLRVSAFVIAPEGKDKAPVLPGADRVLYHEGVSPEGREGLPSLIAELRGLSCDAAVIFTSAGQSPYAAAYLCYLAGIPVRIGHSVEFGGGVLTHWVKTLPEMDPVDRHLSLLRLINPPSQGATPAF